MILENIAASKRICIEKAKKTKPLKKIIDSAFEKIAVSGNAGKDTDFTKALTAAGISFICEIKKASPSKGIIAHDFPYMDIAKDYEAGGAAAISVLTETDFFKGSNEYLENIAKTAKIPILRKDFIIDSYQIYETVLLGANALLFICALLDAKTLANFIEISKETGLAALVEVHNKEEIKTAIDAGAKIIGINNRDLKTFNVDISVTGKLREYIPSGIIVISESGISSPKDVAEISKYKVDGILIGETLMRSFDKKKYLAELREAAL
jgi:indole-3-glycerol phosphate synthase